MNKMNAFNSYAGTGQTEPAGVPIPRNLEGAMNSLDAQIERLSRYSTQLYAVADRLCSARYDQESPNCKTASVPVGVADRLFEKIDALSSILDSISISAERLDNI